jgi:hypothetical protein
MRFTVVGRGIDVQLKHFLIILGAIIPITIITATLFTTYTYLSPQDYQTVTTGASAMLLSIRDPLFAFLFLLVAGRFFKTKKNVALCRALVAAFFIFYVVLHILTTALVIIIPVLPFLPLANIAAILGSAWSTIVIYLWLLIFLKPDAGRLKKTAQYAAIFMIANFLIGHFYGFFSTYPTSAYVLELGIEMLPWLVSDFFFGIALLYFAEDIKKLGKEAYLFSGLYMGTVLFSILGNSYYNMDYAQAAWPLVSNAITLILIYLLSLILSERKKK